MAISLAGRLGAKSGDYPLLGGDMQVALRHVESRVDGTLTSSCAANPDWRQAGMRLRIPRPRESDRLRF